MDVKPSVSFPLLFCRLIEFLNLFVAVTSYYIDKEMQIARLELEGCGGIAGRRGERTQKGFRGRRNEGPPPLLGIQGYQRFPLFIVDASSAARQSDILIFIEPMSIFVFLSPHFSFFFPQFSSVSPDVVDWAQSTN